MWVREGKISHSDQSFSASVSSWSSLDSLFPVGREIERNEEQKVRAQDDQAGDSSKFLACASTGIWHPREVGAGEVGVRCEVDKSQIDDKLDDLHDGNIFLPPDLDTPG